MEAAVAKGLAKAPADRFQRAAEFLTAHDIALRAFVLLKPPFMPADECVDWALKSIEFAFACGVESKAKLRALTGFIVDGRRDDCVRKSQRSFGFKD